MKATFSRATQGGGPDFARVLAVFFLLLAQLAAVGDVAAQTRTAPQVGTTGASADQRTPNRRAIIKFVTTSDHPPFSYFDENGELVGFNVDMARAVCLELAAACDLQVKPWDDLVPAIRKGEADAIAASHAIGPRLLKLVGTSDRYYYTPGRFAGDRRAPAMTITPDGLQGRRIAVAKGTAHEAYLRAFFTLSTIQAYENADLARDAVRNKTADLLFDDAIGLVFWINGDASRTCCEFKGDAFTEARFFGDGVGFLLKREDLELHMLINAALKRIRETGRHDELMLRYFPIRPY